MNFRYANIKRFYKGNTHIHTTGSDGRWSPDEAMARYQDAGYDFICVTDHNVVTRLEHRSTRSFCLIDSVELDRPLPRWRTQHVVCLGVGPDFPDRTSYSKMLAAVRRDNALTVLAHPHWSGGLISRFANSGFCGVEVYNGVCYYINHKEDGTLVWDELLRTGLDPFGFAADDNHGRPDGCRPFDLGWIHVAADRLDRQSILSAIRAGRFYSSTGPQFRSLKFSNGKLSVRCTPARHIWLNGPAWVMKRVNCPDGKTTEEHTFDVAALLADNPGLPYLRLEIEDPAGRRAWTNKLFT